MNAPCAIHVVTTAPRKDGGEGGGTTRGSEIGVHKRGPENQQWPWTRAGNEKYSGAEIRADIRCGTTLKTYTPEPLLDPS